MNQCLLDHLAVLEEKVFQTSAKWPQFRLLLADLRQLSGSLPEDATVVSLERTLLYGGFSLIAPLFPAQKFISVDCSPPSADERGAYNRSMVDDPRFVKIPVSHRALIDDTGLPSECADIVLVPNLVHHVADQDVLFHEMARLARPGGKVYVFEALVRELHQIPDDYLRYTPFGLARVMRKAGLEPGPAKLEGGPFSVITYCWTQALQYLPEDERAEKEKWFYETHFRELMALDAKYQTNLMRPHTSFPMSFSIMARKPGRQT
jgi:SAM-dependent methyltransferase